MPDDSHITRQTHKHMLASVDPQQIVQQLQQGHSLRQVAIELGVSHTAIRAWLLRENSEQYHDAITAALATRVAEADDNLDAAEDMIAIARAREQCRFGRMDLERRRPGLYGVRQEITVKLPVLDLAFGQRAVGVQVGVSERVIDNDPDTDQ